MATRKIKVTRKVTVRRMVRVQSRVTVQPRAAPRSQPIIGSTSPAAEAYASRAALPRPSTSSKSRALRSGRSPVAEVRDNLQEVIGEDPRDYDVFISHASPDKDEVVRPLATLLREGGLEVWYDEFTLRVGDSLRRRIDQGIRSARFGIVVFSPAFLKGRPWTEHELDGLVNGYIYNRQVLLPIWHGVDGEQVADYSPSLADKVALSTADATLEEIAQELLEQIRGTGDKAA